MEKTEIQNKVSSIVNRLAPLTPASQAEAQLSLAADQNALAMDSVAALQLVLAIEEELGVTFEDGDICAENFRDLASLCRFVENKLARS